jgi:hypothetical protein
VSFCCVIACSSRERVLPLYVRVNVDRTILCFSAILDYGILSVDAKVLHSESASSNPIALCCYGAEIIEVFWWFGAFRESAHCAHGHGRAAGLLLKLPTIHISPTWQNQFNPNKYVCKRVASNCSTSSHEAPIYRFESHTPAYRPHMLLCLSRTLHHFGMLVFVIALSLHFLNPARYMSSHFLPCIFTIPFISSYSSIWRSPPASATSPTATPAQTYSATPTPRSPNVAEPARPA